MNRLKVSSFTNSDGVKCWKIVDREGEFQPVTAVLSHSNQRKYIVSPEDRPMILKDIKDKMLKGDYDFFPDTYSEIVANLAAAFFDDKPTTRDCASPVALLVLALSGHTLDEKVLRETLDAYGYLNDNGYWDLETAKAVYDHHVTEEIEE